MPITFMMKPHVSFGGIFLSYLAVVFPSSRPKVWLDISVLLLIKNEQHQLRRIQVGITSFTAAGLLTHIMLTRYFNIYGAAYKWL